MRKLMIATAVAAIAVSAPANAQTVTKIFTNGVYTNPFPLTPGIIQTFNNGGADNSQYAPFKLANETLSAGSDIRIQTGSLPGTSADPEPGGGNKYLNIVNGTYTITLPQASAVFSFILGSLDTYNSVTLFFAGGAPSQTYTGANIIGIPNVFDGNGNSGTAGRVTYDLGGTGLITQVAFSSSQAAFEIDTLSSAVPEPAAWGMMILGFGMIGGQLRSRRTRKTTLAIA